MNCCHQVGVKSCGLLRWLRSCELEGLTPGHADLEESDGDEAVGPGATVADQDYRASKLSRGTLPGALSGALPGAEPAEPAATTCLRQGHAAREKQNPTWA